MQTDVTESKGWFHCLITLFEEDFIKFQHFSVNLSVKNIYKNVKNIFPL